MTSLLQEPSPGEHFVHFVGDRLRFTLRLAEDRRWPTGWRAFLRTDLGRAEAIRAELIAAVEQGRPPTRASWHDVPMTPDGQVWTVELPLTEVGYFRAKAYAVDERDWQHWPDGPDVGVNVQPDYARTANTLYCAFVRLFGGTKSRAQAAADSPAGLFDQPGLGEAELKVLEAQGYAVIPPSGKLRDLIQELPHIIDRLGCRILHLLPVNPTPTTYARFGRFGSPYAGQDLLAIDPALIDFDRRTTGVDQFRELAYGVHQRGARLFLDIVINHTGWGATLQETHPEWFQRRPDGTFVSPGAWGVTWEDLVELEHAHPELRRHLADVFLEWCRRGVDGFRCDAGYQVPLPVWQYLTARVRQEFPDTVFLLEGLGGAWVATEALLTEGGLQWAYSELFQNESGLQVSGYLDHALRQSARAGLLVHYSETHDNNRLAARGRAWALLRNRLSALTSVSGGFGFTCGVEWLATEKIRVHGCTGLNWGQPENLVSELARLNRLLAEHPCFFDAARLTRLSPPGAPVYVLLRESSDGLDAVLVLVNTNATKAQSLTCNLPTSTAAVRAFAETAQAGQYVDLLEQSAPVVQIEAGGHFTVKLEPAAAFCLAATTTPAGPSGEAYRRRRAQEALALTTLSQLLPSEQLGGVDVDQLAAWLDRDPAGFLSATTYVPPDAWGPQVLAAMESAAEQYARVVVWRLPDRHRVTLVPGQHWLLILDDTPFRAALVLGPERTTRREQSIAVQGGHLACFLAPIPGGDATLRLERYDADKPWVQASLRFLADSPSPPEAVLRDPAPTDLVLLTNGRGGMARLCVDLGRITSKYDCLLGANLHPRLPVDRHVLVKRVRVWVNADGFICPLNADNLVSFSAGPPARWFFAAHAGDNRQVGLLLRATMLPDQNTTVLEFQRTRFEPTNGWRELPPTCDVRLTVRLDVEDRNFHWETKRNSGAEHHFATHTTELKDAPGFAFAPASDRQLRVVADTGDYHPQPEWCENVPHPIEATRGQVGSGDAYSPGWFELPLGPGGAATLVVTAEPAPPTVDLARQHFPDAATRLEKNERRAGLPNSDSFGRSLVRAVQAFVVRRDEVQTVIAGYPWFLDWGRDTLICARGLLAAGLVEEVVQMLQGFGRFEQDGTLPNTIHGEDASNRDTSDAPLWFGIACEEAAARRGAGVYATVVDGRSRTLADVLRSIAAGYLRGTPNGIRVDPASALVWSPSHFTWMDTNYPAGTPREGYPVEVQALWIRLLRQLDRLAVPPVTESWAGLAKRALANLEDRFWLAEPGWYADVLLAGRKQPAAQATPRVALRSNGLFLVSLGLVTGERAQRVVEAARRFLLVPGGLRSLAPLAVSPPLPIRGGAGQLLNDPDHPYCGRYVGDEDTRRKPAYHNGTVWVWTLPTFCEALARAWNFTPASVAAARGYLASVEALLAGGCVGQLPEVLDGDAPHTPRGCDAQAWSVTEVLRVWRLLQETPRTAEPALG